MTQINVFLGDIVSLRVDAIVNAAKNSLLGGSGVDGAIHRAAGPGLLAACRTLNGCDTGDARMTEGYQLPARFVIHTVGPVWRGGGQLEAGLLASCYRRCLEIAMESRLQSIAFPAISTGIYGYPIDQATQIAVSTVRKFLTDRSSPAAKDSFEVTFVCFDQSIHDVYLRTLGSQSCLIE
jgi:O-acetyl-ADP-ribose deacetylase